MGRGGEHQGVDELGGTNKGSLNVPSGVQELVLVLGVLISGLLEGRDRVPGNILI